MEQTKHNPDYKLIEVTIKDKNSYVELVYGIANDGSNEGLEAYYKRERDKHFHKSRRWAANSLPKKYVAHFNGLKMFLDQVLPGHKLIVQLASIV